VPDPWGFHTIPYEPVRRRPVPIRLQDWGEVYERPPADVVQRQAGRCMDCGVPFCHGGCPLGNLIPDWNDLVWRDDWRAAAERLHATNNFPEFTGRLCPAPCEPACVLGLVAPPVAIKSVEQAIADRAYERGWVVPQPPDRLTGRTVAVVGSGPAGLAAAQQLTRAGHTVAVYERDDRIGGLLRYGIPDFKMDKALVDARVAQMTAEGTVFRTGVDVGVDVGAQELRDRYDAVVLAAGALRQREVPLPGRELAGIHLAMEYLVQGNRVQAGDLDSPPIDARDRRVVIMGGGDTAADCLGTAHRQGAARVVQLDLHPRPPADRHPETPWPTWPLVLRESASHEEGGDREFAIRTLRFLDDGAGRVRGLEVAVLLESTPDGRAVRDGAIGEPFVVEGDLVLLAIGFDGPDCDGVVDGLGLSRSGGGLARDVSYATGVPGVFVAGDMGRGASLVVWAIAEGRACAAAVDRWLTGSTHLPAPVSAHARPLR